MKRSKIILMLKRRAKALDKLGFPHLAEEKGDQRLQILFDYLEKRKAR